MDAWFESVVLAMAIAAIGFTALGSRFETWRAAPAPAGEVRCIALHGDALDHKPRCATTAALAADATVDDTRAQQLIRD
jgi:hypothetical protein